MKKKNESKKQYVFNKTPIIILVIFLLLFAGIYIFNKLEFSILSIPTFDTTQELPLHKKVLILYDDENQLDYGSLYAVMLRNILGHFVQEVTLKPLAKYQPEENKKYHALFYLGYDNGVVLPKHFVKDVIESNNPVVWLQYNFDQFQDSVGFDFEEEYGFIFEKNVRYDPATKLTQGYFDHFLYKSQVLERDSIPDFVTDMDIGKVVVSDVNKATVWAKVKNPITEEVIPYIIQSKNLWYIADIPFAYMNLHDRYLIVCDILHEVFATKIKTQHYALMRLEDIHPAVIPSELERVCTYFNNEGIPYSMGIIPFFKDPKGYESGKTRDISYADVPVLLNVIQEQQKQGAALIMHGVTHQVDEAGDPKLLVTGIGYEFWDYENDIPLSFETAEWVHNRIKIGKEEMGKHKLKPCAFEMPHYTGSALCYRVVAEEFDTTYQSVSYHLYSTTQKELTPEQRDAMKGQWIDQHFPYVVYKDFYGQKVLPSSTVSFISYEDAQTEETLEARINKILKEAEAVKVVRDGYAAFYLHPFVLQAIDNKFGEGKGLSILKRLVKGFRALGYRFVDIREIE